MKKYTPLQELTKRENRLKSQIHYQEEKIINELRYVRDHAGSLVLSALVGNLLSPLRKGEGSAYGDSSGRTVLGLTRVGSVINKIMPLAVTLLAPQVLRWAGGRIGSLFRISGKE